MSADAAEARKDQEELAMLAGELGAKAPASFFWAPFLTNKKRCNSIKQYSFWSYE